MRIAQYKPVPHLSQLHKAHIHLSCTAQRTIQPPATASHKHHTWLYSKFLSHPLCILSKRTRMATVSLASLGRKPGYMADMTMPQIPAAGIKTGLNENAKDALTWQERPPTPDEQKRFRQSTLHEPGKIVRHPGAYSDAIPEGPFGDKSASAAGQTVVETIRQYPDSEIARWKLEQQEAVYARQAMGSRTRMQTFCSSFWLPSCSCRCWRSMQAACCCSTSPAVPFSPAAASVSRWARATSGGTSSPTAWAPSGLLAWCTTQS